MMGPRRPEEWWPLLQQAMSDGDLEAVLALYEPGATFADRAGGMLSGHDEPRQQFAPFAAANADFLYEIRKINTSGDLALVHSETRMTKPQPAAGRALEVPRRQADEQWLLAIGDPFTLGPQ